MKKLLPYLSIPVECLTAALLFWSWRAAVIYAVTIIVHEAGHFIVSLLVGYKHRGIKFSVDYVAITGDFQQDTVAWKIFFTTFAGPAMNIISAIVAAAVLPHDGIGKLILQISAITAALNMMMFEGRDGANMYWYAGKLKALDTVMAAGYVGMAVAFLVPAFRHAVSVHGGLWLLAAIFAIIYAIRFVAPAWLAKTDNWHVKPSAWLRIMHHAAVITALLLIA